MNSSRKTEKRPVLILILGLLTALGPLATDMYLPAFEDIAQKLNTPINTISFSLSSFFIGLSIGQLIYGPMLERFGRRKPIYVGLAIFIIASIGCSLSASVYSLIVFRFFQAIGSCAGLVSARAIVRDLFEDEEVARVFSLLMVVVAVSPILAPTLGGFITIKFGWPFVFVLLALLAVVIFIGAFLRLPESRPANPKHSLRPKPVVRGYINVISDKQFAVYAIAGSISYAGVYAYLSGSPHIYMEIFEVSKSQYSVIFAFIAAGLIGASQINNLLLRKNSSTTIVFNALIFQCILSFILILSFYLGATGLYSTTFLIFLYMSCLGFIFPNASALSMVNLRHTAGNASALLGSVQMVMGAIASAFVSLFQGIGSVAMFLVMSLCAVLAICLLFFGKQKLSAGYV